MAGDHETYRTDLEFEIRNESVEVLYHYIIQYAWDRAEERTFQRHAFLEAEEEVDGEMEIC